MTVGRLAIVAGAIALSGAVAAAQQPQPSPPEAVALTRQLMSPFCHGRLLADCPSPNAADLRIEIASRITAGESPSQVQADLLARFGPEIKGSPEASGLGLLVWWGPGLAGLAGLLLVVVTVRRSASRAGNRAGDAVVAVGSGHAAALARLDDELAELD